MSPSADEVSMPLASLQPRGNARPTGPARGLTALNVSPAPSLAPRDRPILFVLQGREQGAVYPISTGSLLIGREASASLSLTDDTVSREHARLSREPDGVYLEDLSSLNGTYVNERQLVGRIRLESGDQLRFGEHTIVKFSMVDELEERALRTLFELTVHDPLTRLYNRRYFDARLNSELAFARRHGTPVALLLIDIDHFKNVNDRYGHPVGDLVLKRVAAALLSILRPEDVLARFGGEEFTVIVRNVKRAGAESFAERVRRSIEGLSFNEPELQITVSVGVACGRPGLPPPSAEGLIAAADEALYRAKESGRNCLRATVVSPTAEVGFASGDTIPPAAPSANP